MDQRFTSPEHTPSHSPDSALDRDTIEPRKRGFRKARIAFFSTLLALLIGSGSYVWYICQDLPTFSEISNPQRRLSSQIISSDGIVLDNLFAKENRVQIGLNEISPYVIDALIATEDTRFFQHSGMDQWVFISILKRYIGGTTSGGSTLTMQLARNMFDKISMERSIHRKIREIVVSLQLERMLTKQEILAAYLNTVNIYGNTFGIEMAAQRLFSKPARDLNLEESATLVAMLKGQGVYHPIRHPERVTERRNLVIGLMKRHELLDLEQTKIDSVIERPLETAPPRAQHVEGIAPYFRQQVRSFAYQWCRENTKPNGEPYDLYEDGLRIYTTLDTRLQQHAENAVKNHLTKLQGQFDRHLSGYAPYDEFPDILQRMMVRSDRYKKALEAGMAKPEIIEQFNQSVEMSLFSWNGPLDTTMTPMDSLKYYARVLETGSVSIDPRTGQVKAWVGGVDFEHFKYDHVSVGKRQAGSTFKPFVYLTAIANGYSPCELALNQPVVFEPTFEGGKRWVPRNSDGKFGGKMTLRKALATSTNLVTAQLVNKFGLSSIIDHARMAGIESPLEAVPTLCLGTADLSVLELTGAYCTFANHGERIKPYFVSRIEDKQGNVIAEFVPERKQVINEHSAYLMVEMLKGVVDEPGGTAGRLRYKYQFRNEIGGKTGTTQNHADGWFIGVTQNLVTGVWVGCSDRRMRFNSMKLGQGAHTALPIWALYMQSVYGDDAMNFEPEPFEKPAGYISLLNCEDAEESMDFAVMRGQDPDASDPDADLDIFE
ncbi:transglycosylase domain-containing protein [Pontibacter sp. G13]|uniref:penicillin-binding protein 1A n=1 Tax=Pontibacter sp. G13 TaxID=3074898 RepID=UPI00288C42D0|nr:transglycosylase domain-containing protein [Pontibacter sp. G13]WNJ21399.1 transglycosylase domain-containing protein [Pontibacter sp. G13]